MMRRIKIYHHPTATDGPLVASCDGCSVGIASIADVTGYRAGSEVEVGDFSVTPTGIIEAFWGMLPRVRKPMPNAKQSMPRRSNG